MLRWFLQRQIAAFERTWNYDAGYIHEVIDVDPRAMLAFGKLIADGQGGEVHRHQGRLTRRSRHHVP